MNGAQTDKVQLAMRSVLLVVSCLERSVRFYQSVVGFREQFREDQLAVMVGSEEWRPTLVLREGYRNALHSGAHAIGLRAISFDVGDVTELDRMEKRLNDHQALRCRGRWGENGRLEYVQGSDPDRIPLFFVAVKGTPTVCDIRASLGLLYGADL
jgi:catechol 2,3-dioxygenase-like lactoylglutathione lyase family enzyme